MIECVNVVVYVHLRDEHAIHLIVRDLKRVREIQGYGGIPASEMAELRKRVNSRNASSRMRRGKPGYRINRFKLHIEDACDLHDTADFLNKERKASEVVHRSRKKATGG